MIVGLVAFAFTGIAIVRASSSSWTPIAPLPSGRLNTCAAGLADGSLIVIGGFGYPPVDYFASCLAYNVSTNTWTALPDLPESRDALACAVLDGAVYAVGGESGEYPFTLTSVVRLEPGGGTAGGRRWTAAGNLTDSRQSHSAAVLDGALYAAGGLDANDRILASAERYDARTKAWAAIAPMRTARYYHGLAALRGLLYAVGGLDASFSVLASVETYDPSTGAWGAAARLPSPRERFGLAVVHGSLVVLGGCHNDQNRVQGLTNSSIRFDPARRAWAAARPSLPRPNGEFGVGVVGGDALFVVGGGLAFSRNATYRCDGCFA